MVCLIAEDNSPEVGPSRKGMCIGAGPSWGDVHLVRTHAENNASLGWLTGLGLRCEKEVLKGNGSS